MKIEAPLRAKLFALLAVIFFISEANAQFEPTVSLNHKELYFLEQVGQIKTQNGAVANDVSYIMQTEKMILKMGKNKITYVFANAKGKKAEINVSLINASAKPALIAENQQDYYEVYYQDALKGAKARTYKRLVYKNVYPGIDWAFYINGNKLEHEFYVAAGADAAQIKLQYSGDAVVKKQIDGGLAARTRIGIVEEDSPVCYDSKGNIIASSFKLTDKTLAYSIAPYKGSMVIDPSIRWSTYYGSDSVSPYVQFFGICTERNANIYVSGSTNAMSNIASPGAFQKTRTTNATPTTGSTNAILVKFDSTGKRLWATYYGGNMAGEIAVSLICDGANNVYMGGWTQSSSGISTAGTQQSTFGGVTDGYIVKFNSVGARIWSTYVGGSGSEEIHSLNCDQYGSLYASGSTNSGGLASSGSHQPNLGGPVKLDCFLMKYDTATGKRIWGTYYGGTGDDGLCKVFCQERNVYLAGQSESDTGITTTGSHQPIKKTLRDAFLVKFDSAGKRIWGTYFGGEGDDVFATIICTEANIYIGGQTNSTTGIADTGSWQKILGGGYDAFLAEFDQSGKKGWSTYIGGTGAEIAGGVMARENSGNLYLSGITSSSTGIADATGWQTICGGGLFDYFLMKFNSSGSKVWASYMGGEGKEISGGFCTGVAYDGKHIYMAGSTESKTGISTSGSYMPVAVRGANGFLAKIKETEGSNISENTISINEVKLLPNPSNGALF